MFEVRKFCPQCGSILHVNVFLKRMICQKCGAHLVTVTNYTFVCYYLIFTTLLTTFLNYIYPLKEMSWVTFIGYCILLIFVAIASGLYMQKYIIEKKRF